MQTEHEIFGPLPQHKHWREASNAADAWRIMAKHAYQLRKDNVPLTEDVLAPIVGLIEPPLAKRPSEDSLALVASTTEQAMTTSDVTRMFEEATSALAEASAASEPAQLVSADYAADDDDEDDDCVETSFKCACPECVGQSAPSTTPLPKSAALGLRIPNPKKGAQRTETLATTGALERVPPRRLRKKTSLPRVAARSPAGRPASARAKAKKRKLGHVVRDDIVLPARMETRSTGPTRPGEAYILDSKPRHSYVIGCSANRSPNYLELMDEALGKILARELTTRLEVRTWLNAALAI